MLKILQARPQQYVNQELLDVQTGFRKGRCCKLVEQRPEPARRLKDAANCALAIVLVSMLDGHSWGRTCSLLHLTACPCVCPHGNKTRCSWSTAVLTLLPLHGVVIKLPRIAIPWWSHVTSACKSACRKEPFCLPAMENRRALCLPACQIICISLFITPLAPVSGLSHPLCWTRQAEEPEIKLPNPLDYRKSKRIPEEHLLLLHWLH